MWYQIVCVFLNRCLDIKESHCFFCVFVLVFFLVFFLNLFAAFCNILAGPSGAAPACDGCLIGAWPARSVSVAKLQTNYSAMMKGPKGIIEKFLKRVEKSGKEWKRVKIVERVELWPGPGNPLVTAVMAL